MNLKVIPKLFKLMISLTAGINLTGCGDLSGEITGLVDANTPSKWSTKITTSSDAVTILEGNGLTFLGGLDEEALTDTVFRWEISATTNNNNRFVASSGEGTVLAGKKNFSFVVQTVNDSLFQGNSDYTLRVGGTNFENEVDVQIQVIDDETHIGLSLANASVSESAGHLSLTFALSKAATENISFDYATANSTAIAGQDFTGLSGTATIAAGQTQATVSLVILSDALDEADETLSINISKASDIVAILTPSATLTILDDDAPPTLAVNDVTVGENAGPATFTVSLSQPSEYNVVVNYVATGGTAIVGVDFPVTIGSLTIPAGQSAGTISIPITNDNFYEGDETVTLDLSSATNATISDNQGLGTISDDDSAPTISIASASLNEDAGSMQFVVTKSGNTALPITVDYVTADASASSSSDYTSTTGTLTIAAGSASGTISVPIAADSTAEGNETFTLTISNPSGATISTAAATGTITNEDAPTISGITANNGTTAGGTTITIAGTGFLSGATATVGGATCTSPSVVSSISFTCVTPAAASGAVDVILSNSAGSQPSGTRSVTSTNGYTYRTDNWNFGTAGHFTYDSTLFTTSQALNKATLTPLDLTSNTQTEFDAGTYVGTTFSSSRLTVDTANVQSELASGWTPQWANLFGFWTFNGNWQDSSGNARHGTGFGGASTVTTEKKLGSGSGSFDGSSSYVKLSNTGVVAATGTVMAWIKPSSSLTLGQIIMVNPTNAGHRIYFQISAGKLAARLGSTAQFTSGVTVPLNTWSQVGLTWNNGEGKLYFNGALVATNTYTGLTAITDELAIGAFYGIDNTTIDSFFHGFIDEVAIWKTTLSEAEMLKLFSRQVSKYGGHFTSAVQTVPVTNAWSNFNWLTSLPFGKELPGDTDASGAPDGESAADYSAIASANEDLANGLEAIWHFNETGCNGTGNEIKDSSGYGRHGKCNTGSTTNVPGVLNNAFYLPGDSTTTATVAAGVAPNPGNQMTVSFWFLGRSSYYPTDDFLTGKNDASSGWQILTNGSSPVDDLYVRIDTSGATNQAKYALKNIFDDKFHHIVLILDQGNGRWMVDGKTTNTFTYTHGTGFANTGSVVFGTQSRKANFDEYGVWSRALSVDEVLQLYRRGANRNKFQFRTCVQADCSDNTAFRGPDNTGATWFSELHNMTAVAASGEGSGITNLLSPKLNFTKWIAAVSSWAFNPNPAQYFQYRAMMESDDENNMCSSAPCLPDISAASSIPAVAITTTIGRAFPSALSQLNVTRSGDCGTADDVKFQVSSDDGTTYKYWSGSAWTAVTTAGSYAQSASLTTTNANVSTLASSGTFKFKAIVPSQYGKTCELLNPYILW